MNKEEIEKLFENIFDPIVELKGQRFNIWNYISQHKDKKDLLIYFNDKEGKQYVVVNFKKLLDLLNFK